MKFWIQTLLPPASDILLNIIFYNCSKSCGFNHSCRKVGLRCSGVCSNCHGQSCTNYVQDIIEDINADIDEEIYPINLVEAVEIEETDTEIIESEEILKVDKTEN